MVEPLVLHQRLCLCPLYSGKGHSHFCGRLAQLVRVGPFWGPSREPTQTAQRQPDRRNLRCVRHTHGEWSSSLMLLLEIYAVSGTKRSQDAAGLKGA